jgi:hypothetical protein
MEFLYTTPYKHRDETGMTNNPRQNITGAKNQKQVVIVDRETFNRMESIIEDNGLRKIHESGRSGSKTGKSSLTSFAFRTPFPMYILLNRREMLPGTIPGTHNLFL